MKLELGGIFFVIFIALKVMGYAWSWWWLLMPAVPVLVELFRYLGNHLH